MNIKDFNQLDRGDIIRHKSGGDTYLVNSNYGHRVTAVTTKDLTNPDEWELILKAKY
jgi:hypothetical protein